MNRPLRRKLENLVLAFLDHHKTGKAYASVTMTTGGGTTLADEIALDASTTPESTAEPGTPFLAVQVETTPDPDLPGVATAQIILHLKSDGTAEDAHRNATDAILRDLYDVLIQPPDDAAAFTDANKEFGALRVFANKPAGSDTRPTYRKPLHLYNAWLQSMPNAFDGDHWHDQIILTAHAQDMDESS
jgi:hypothetical protein